MDKYYLIAALFILSACVGNVKEMDVSSASAETAYLVLDVDATFDGNKSHGGSMSGRCGFGARGFDSLEKLDGLSVAAIDDGNFVVYKSLKPGTYSFDGFGCQVYKVLWTKSRSKRLDPPLEIELKAGEITYPGTVVVDWESEGFGALDVINGGGGLAEDGGHLVLKRDDRTDAVKRKLMELNSELMRKFNFTTTQFKDNPRIIQ